MSTAATCHQSSLKKYRPILLATSLVVLLTVLRSIVIAQTGDRMLMVSHVMDGLMGFFFLVYGLPKFINLPAFAQSLSKYDIIAQRFQTYGFVYPVIEVVFGLLYLFGNGMHSFQHAVVLNGTVAVFCLVNAIGIAGALRRKQDASCACLGTTFNVPLSGITLLENIIMLGMAVAMIVGYHALSM